MNYRVLFALYCIFYGVNLIIIAINTFITGLDQIITYGNFSSLNTLLAHTIFSIAFFYSAYLHIKKREIAFKLTLFCLGFIIHLYLATIITSLIIAHILIKIYSVALLALAIVVFIYCMNPKPDQ